MKVSKPLSNREIGMLFEKKVDDLFSAIGGSVCTPRKTAMIVSGWNRGAILGHKDFFGLWDGIVHFPNIPPFEQMRYSTFVAPGIESDRLDAFKEMHHHGDLVPGLVFYQCKRDFDSWGLNQKQDLRHELKEFKLPNYCVKLIVFERGNEIRYEVVD